MAGGFREVSEREPFPAEPGRYLAVREGSIIAWSTEHADGAATPFRVVGGHTDSPNLRLKPNPDYVSAGWQMLGVEVYGGPLLNSWLDRDLGLSGRLVVRGAHGPEQVLVRVDDPILRVSQLCIHFNRNANDELALNAQQHMTPHWGVGQSAADVKAFICDAAGVELGDLLAFDLMTHDLTPSRRIGRDRDLIAAPRLDNQGTCAAATDAMVAACDEAPAEPLVRVMVLFDHEEIGSMTNRGGFSQMLPAVLERIVTSRGGTRDDYLAAIAGSVICSADMAHATHPNYADLHDARHPIRINGGPVTKINAKGRYASDALGIAHWRTACAQAGVPVQDFVMRNDMPAGSTIGPMSSALTGAVTVDVGAPMLSMHSSRELCGAEDPAMYTAALAAFLSPA